MTLFNPIIKGLHYAPVPNYHSVLHSKHIPIAKVHCSDPFRLHSLVFPPLNNIGFYLNETSND